MAIKKQSISESTFAQLWETADTLITEREIDLKSEKTSEEIYRNTKGKRCAFGWTGGKDSITLRHVCEMAGIYDCLLAISEPDLEYGEYLTWLSNHSPENLSIISSGHDLKWLSRHPEMLFPSDSKISSKWFSIVQHKIQDQYTKDNGLDVLILGRRRQDGNYLGPKGKLIYTTQKGTRYNPIGMWTHQEVFALCKHKNYPLPPFYSWPRGFKVGTGGWPKRKRNGTIRETWKEILQIDPSIVTRASEYFESAREFL